MSDSPSITSSNVSIALGYSRLVRNQIIEYSRYIIVERTGNIYDYLTFTSSKDNPSLQTAFLRSAPRS